MLSVSCDRRVWDAGGDICDLVYEGVLVGGAPGYDILTAKLLEKSGWYVSSGYNSRYEHRVVCPECRGSNDNTRID